MTKFYLLLLGYTLIFYSCKTASKAYNKGDYADAIELGIKKLQKDPNDYETKELVKSAYNYAISQKEDEIRILSNGNNELKYDRIYSQYLYLQDLYSTIRQSPAAAKYINAKDYSEYIETYRQKATEVHLDKAQKWMDLDRKEAYREAYKEYQTALRYNPDNFDIKGKRDDAYNLAITKVLVIPMESYGSYRYSSTYQLRNFQNDIMRTLAYNMNNDFVKFYTEFDLRNQNLEPDQIMELNLSRITIGQPYDEKSVKESSKEVVVKETVYSKDSVVKQYAKVYAKLTTTKRTLVSEGDLFITLRDTKGRTVWNDRFTGEHRWQTEFTTYTGDERALTDADKALLNKKDQNTPRQDEIFEELLRKIQSDIHYRIRNYYSRYN